MSNDQIPMSSQTALIIGHWDLVIPRAAAERPVDGLRDPRYIPRQ